MTPADLSDWLEDIKKSPSVEIYEVLMKVYSRVASKKTKVACYPSFIVLSQPPDPDDRNEEYITRS